MHHARRLLSSAFVLAIAAAASLAALALASAALGRDGGSGSATSGPRLGHEVASMRTSHSRTFVTDGGTYVTRSYGAPVNYRSGGEWLPIDDKLGSSSAPGYAYENSGNSYSLSLPDALDGKPVKVENGSDSVSFTLQGAKHVAPAALGALAGYTAGLPGVNVTYEPLADRVKEELVLQGPDSPTTFKFDVQLSDGLRARDNDVGGIDFVDESGDAKLAFAPPSMRDAAGAQSTDVKLKTRDTGSGYEVTVSADKGWLASSARRYPVSVDPTTTSLDPIDDCYMVGGTQAAQHFCGYSWDWEDLGTDGSGNPRRPFQKYDLSAVPKDAEVVEGQLHIHTEDGAQREVDLYRLQNHDSTTSRTWNTYDGTNAWGTPGGDIPSSADGKNSAVGGTPGWYELEARDLVQGWVDKSISNYGLELKDVGTNNVMHISAEEQGSLGPFLEVEWHNRTGIQDRWSYEDQRLSDRLKMKTNVANGNLLLEESDIHIPGRAGHDLDFKRYFNSRELDVGGSVDDLGRYWRTNSGYDVWLKFEGNGSTAAFFGPSGFVAPYDKKDDGSFETPTGMNADLKKNADNTYTLKYRKTAQKLNFDSTGENLTSDKDRNDNAISFAYSGPGGKLSSIKDTHDQGSANNTLTFTYNGSGYVDTITDRANPQRSWHYGYSGNLLTSYTNPDGEVTQYGYDGSENLTDITDPRGNGIHMTYDSLRRVTSIRRWSDAAHTVGPLTQYSYPTTMDSSCSAVSKATGETIETDPNNHTNKYCWDDHQRVVKTIDGRGKSRGKSWTANSDAGQISSAGAQAWDLGYDSSDRNINAKGPQATGQSNRLQETYGYNPAITDKSDSRFWLQTSLTDTQNNNYSFNYDSEGNVTDVIDGRPSLNKIHIVPAADGSPSSITEANTTSTTSYGYNSEGDLTSIDRPGTFLGSESFTYDPAHPHTIKTHTDGRGKVATYTYDPLDRTLQISYSDGTFVAYSYDENGNITQRLDALGLTTYSYDRLNRLAQETFPGGKVDIYTYDDVGNLKTLQDAGGTTTYNYGPSNLLDSMQAPGDSAATTFTYNDDNQRKTTTYPNGVVMTATWEDGSSGNGGPNRLKRIKAVKGATTISDFSYGYSTGGRDTALRQSVTDSGASGSYGYDVLSRLTSASNIDGHDYTFSYGANGNLLAKTKDGTTTSYGYNLANELCWSVSGTQPDHECSPTPTGATTYTYDTAGNMISSTSGLSASYNAKEQVTSSTGLLGEAAISMGYFGTNQFERGTAGSKSFVNNGLGVGYETSGASTTYYRRDNGGGLHSERLPSGAIYYYVFDGLGSVTALTDSPGGTAQDTYGYEPYGVTTITGAVPNPWQFASGYHDTNNWYKFGMRYYASRLGRWSQLDPKEQPMDPVDANRYAYGGNDPANRVDPSGLSTVGAGCNGGIGPIGANGGVSEMTGQPSTARNYAGTTYGIGGGCSAMTWTGGSTQTNSESANVTACVLVCVGAGSSGVGVGLGPAIGIDINLSDIL